MKGLILAFFILTFLPALVLAQVQYYGIDNVISASGKDSVSITLTFQNVTNEFNFTVLGKVENFNFTSLTSPIDCAVTSAGISEINCQMNLTQDKRTIQLYYETNDFVRNLNGKNFFDTDFSLNANISQLSVSIIIPEGMVLTDGGIPNSMSFSQNATTLSDGQRIIVLWTLKNIPQSQALRFQLLYENVAVQSIFLTFWPFIVVGAIIIAASVFFILRYSKRPEKMVLSVLDEYEKKVVEIVSNAGGEVNQRKIVQETNLSKAKVSRVIRSLVERGIVEVERLGRTNKIKLVKKKFKL